MHPHQCVGDSVPPATNRPYTLSPWVGRCAANVIEIRDRQDRPIAEIRTTAGGALGEREFALANLIVAAPNLADFAEEFLELFAGDLPSALERMQEHPERLAELQLLASLGVARMHGTAGVSR